MGVGMRTSLQAPLAPRVGTHSRMRAVAPGHGGALSRACPGDRARLKSCPGGARGARPFGSWGQEKKTSLPVYFRKKKPEREPWFWLTKSSDYLVWLLS